MIPTDPASPTGDPYELGFVGYSQGEAEAMLAGGAWGPPREPAPDGFGCAWRLPVVRVGLCDLCSLRGKPFEVFGCRKHGECSIGRRHSRVRSCLACPDRIPLAQGGRQEIS